MNSYIALKCAVMLFCSLDDNGADKSKNNVEINKSIHFDFSIKQNKTKQTLTRWRRGEIDLAFHVSN
jgi:hypothetical protein